MERGVSGGKKPVREVRAKEGGNLFQKSRPRVKGGRETCPGSGGKGGRVGPGSCGWKEKTVPGGGVGIPLFRRRVS